MKLVPFPEKVMVQTVSRCNAACRFCPYPTVSKDLDQGVMEEALFRRIMDECSEHQDEVQSIMLYLMNEPLLDPNIAARINYAKKRNPQATVHILTNGSLLTDKRADALLDSGLDWMGISVHGFSEEAYKEAMGLKRDVTYRRVDRFVERAIRRRGPEWLMVTFNGGGPVTPDEREAELHHFRELGVKRLSFFGSSISRAGNTDVVPAPQNDQVLGCNSIWQPEMLHVLYSGETILCCMDWKRQVKPGSLMGQSISELWHSAPYRAIRDIVNGQRPLPEGFPCSRCEEAIVQPVTPHTSADVALVLIPCAVMDSDGSTLPGVQSGLRQLGMTETLADMSERVYQRMGNDMTHLWHRAGHGVIHHGDGSAELLRECPEDIEWAAARTREVPADHLLFFICEANQAASLEVMRRIKERDPGKFLLAYGTVDKPSHVLDDFGIPYLRHHRTMETAVWAGQSIGRDVQHPDKQPAPEENKPQEPPPAPMPVEPPWRPPGWEGTGAGMVAPAPEEEQPSSLSRALSSLQRAGKAARTFGRSPLLATQEIRRSLGEAKEALVGAFIPGRGPDHEAAPGTAGTPGGNVLGELERPPRAGSGGDGAPEAQAAADSAPLEPARPVPRPEPPAAEDPPEVQAEPEGCSCGHEPPHDDGRLPVPETPWQNRPDDGRPMDVILCTAAPWGFTNPPTALAHLAGYARYKGYGVDVLDLNVDLYHRLGREWELLWHVENKNYWSNETTFDLLLDVIGPHLDEYAKIMAEHPAPLIGFSVVDPKERCTIALIQRIKALAPDKHILLGGPACVTPEYRQIFIDNVAELVDGYAMGEGEAILVEAIERVRAGESLSGMTGVFIQSAPDAEPEAYKRRKRILPLDGIPFPHYEDFLLDRYPGDELIVEWSRGCIGACSFCKGKMIDGKYRTHSAQAILDSLKHYVEFLQINRFTVCDPVLNGDVEEMGKLCQLIIDSGLKLEWRGEAIPHKGQTAEVLQAMREAGCYELQLGVESASPKVLKLMNKLRLFDPETAARVVRAAHEAGIRTALFTIIGFPGEDEEAFMETMNFVKENADYIDELKSINALHIITDTPIHIRAEKYGLCLPEVDYHYKWSTTDGENTHEVRMDRVRRLKELADELGIFVRETNLAEGKHKSLQEALGQEEKSREELVADLQAGVNAISSV